MEAKAKSKGSVEMTLLISHGGEIQIDSRFPFAKVVEISTDHQKSTIRLESGPVISFEKKENEIKAGASKSANILSKSLPTAKIFRLLTD